MTYSAIADVTMAIVELLQKHATKEPYPLDPAGIEAVSPDAVDALSGLELAVCPYRITTDNRSGTAAKQITGNMRTDPPLTLSVRYLLAAYSTDQEESRAATGDGRSGPLERGTRLGAALQILHDNCQIDPAESTTPLYQSEPVTITLVDEPVDEILSLWSQFDGTTYRPTASIEVTPVVIQSLTEEEFVRVDERETRVGKNTDSDKHDDTTDRLDIPDNS
ncbi:DUF4255 domain-containing protein [Salinadaptatus halalkaliphilus]|uniref:DUF4255 domain-containing protein n=1 Tax=Salinadaptatus halalkaliphilus TaxID=2419781 RepID=A0A4S3TL22_9EURY|nr:DUF4255 domain-containing protein [Salinadaptatus halalkaliphilus]THE64831.1 DUF4255 domain-containing protein [Salinadaptatus halalkaliphilus]